MCDIAEAQTLHTLWLSDIMGRGICNSTTFDRF